MDSERWRRIEAVFQRAADCEPQRRGALLDELCAADTGLRAEVESLLAAHIPGSLTHGQAFTAAAMLLQLQAEALPAGRLLGPYRVVREIGQGGMGVVYLAERADETFQKRVAIKVIRRGLDTDAVVQRFRGERAILAKLEHPNIVRLLDGGATEDGRPYFVMEYLEGEPIDRYCDDRKLEITARLRLFQCVCAAVHYAHQNLVIHGDIKPGNVHVTQEGVPRLLDFGIAKLLSPESAVAGVTLAVLRPLTPEYASPEQVRGEPLTTATDVYSLGMLLYVLLTGHSPYVVADASAEALKRAILEQEAQRPSLAIARCAAPHSAKRATPIAPGSAADTHEATLTKLRRRLAGDLDNIVLKALHKDPQRRYASAKQLADDIDRHLGNLPVIARADTAGYRARKFIRRHLAGVAVAALVFATLTGGIVTAIREAWIATQERDRARVERAKAQRLNMFLQDMVGFSDTRPFSPNRRKGGDVTLRDMLDDAAPRVETELADQPDVKAAMLRTIGTTYSSQAKLDLAERYLKEAYDLDLKIHGSDDLETAQAMAGLGAVAYLRGDFAAAQPWLQRSLDAYRKHIKDPELDLHLFVGALSDTAFSMRAQGRGAEAEGLWREALGYGSRLDSKYRAMAIFPKNFLAQLYMERGDLAQAEPLAQQAVDELRALGSDKYPLAESLIDLGSVRGLQSRYEEAASSIEEGTKLFGELLGEQHPNVAYGWLNLSAVHYYQGKYDVAQEDAQTALKIIKGSLPVGSNAYANCYVAIGRALTKSGRSRDAEPLLREALAIREHKVPRHTSPMAGTLAALGESLVAQQRFSEAEPLLAESYETLRGIQVPSSPFLLQARERLLALYEAWGKPQEASAYRSMPAQPARNPH